MFERAKFEASRAANAYEKIGAAEDVEDCRRLLREIGKLNLDGELLERRYFLHVLTFHFKVREPNERIDDCLNFFRCLLALSLVESLNIPTIALLPSFPTARMSSISAFSSRTSFQNLLFRNSSFICMLCYVSLSLVLSTSILHVHIP